MTTTTPSTAATRTKTAIDTIAESWVATEVELSPERRVELGMPGDQSEYGDFSPAHLPAARDQMSRVLRELAAEQPVDDVDRVTALELRRTLELGIDMIDAELSLSDLNNIASPAQNIRMVFDLMPQSTAADLDAVARRMGNVPAAIAGYIETLRAGIRSGKVPARRQVEQVVAQVREYAKPDGFFAQLAASRPTDGVSAGLDADLERGATAAAGAYAQLADMLADELGPVARERDAVGREHYELTSRAFLGARIDLDETYEWGLDELARMAAEQEATAREIVPGGTVADAIAHLDRDPSRKLHGTAALREWMQRTSDEAIEALGRTHFDIAEPIRTLECRIAPTTEGAIYYTGPNDDFSRPGRMWWSVTPGTEDFDTWREKTTVYHEGVPGHHLQIAQAVYLKDTLNAWRRNNWTSGHGEGWALYAERLMEQLGYLEDPADRLGMLDGQRMRAARVVLDIGVHLDKPMPGTGQPWSFDAALEFFRGHVSMGEGFTRFEVNRYFGWPGQAPSYKVGQRVWEQVCSASEAREGAAFNLKEWHARALALGGVGLDTLTAALTAEVG